MTSTTFNVRTYARNHPWSVATLTVALPGVLFFVVDGFLCATGICDETTSIRDFRDRVMSGLTSFAVIDRNLGLSTQRWVDEYTLTVAQILRETSRNTIATLAVVRQRLGLDVGQPIKIIQEHWMLRSALSQTIALVTLIVLPGTFLVLVRKSPDSWTAQHRTSIACAIQIPILMAVAGQNLSNQDLFIAAFVIASFEALQRLLYTSTTSVKPQATFSRVDTTVPKRDLSDSARPVTLMRKHSSSNPEASSMSSGNRDTEIERLHARLAEIKTAEKAREVDLRRTKAELLNARATLNETFQEYASVRDELKMMKQTLGRDHQAVIYRKDIELFALRKANEQKENHIKDREAKLEDINRRHQIALEHRNFELQSLKEKVVLLEQQVNSSFDSDEKIDSATDNDTQAAVQLKFLRVRGMSSTEVDERELDEKDQELFRLKAKLADAALVSEHLHTTQVELRRAWDTTSDMQQKLDKERREHAQTQEKLREAALSIEQAYHGSEQNSPGRLPTIDEQDKQELEAMFNTAQQDNSRLYGEVEALEKRVREANARIFMSEQAAEALREQLVLEKAINDDMETARPSIVHRVHFQRMEGQLKEGREELEAKDEEIKKMSQVNVEKDAKLQELKEAEEASLAAQAKLRNENEGLKKKVAELEATKTQLMLDHERLARHRTRNRTVSAENASARSSGATLITEPSNHVLPAQPTSFHEEPPLPARPVSIASETPNSIQGTPERLLRRDAPTRLNLISNVAPPSELRHTRHKSLNLKGFMRKIARREGDEDEKIERDERRVVENQRPRTALLPKDKNAMIRPKTASPQKNAGESERPKTSAMPSTRDNRPEYAGYQPDVRPKTATAAGPQSSTTDDGKKPKSRGWAASRKLVRKSIA